MNRLTKFEHSDETVTREDMKGLEENGMWYMFYLDAEQKWNLTF